MLTKVKPCLKAVVAFVAPGAVLVGSAVLDTSQGGATITQAEWVTAAVACLVTSATVWRVANTPAPTHDKG